MRLKGQYVMVETTLFFLASTHMLHHLKMTIKHALADNIYTPIKFCGDYNLTSPSILIVADLTRPWIRG